MTITQLGYVGLEVADLDRWESLGRDVLGLAPRPRASDGTLYFRMDQRYQRLVVKRGPREGLAFAGFEVPDAAALEAVAKRLAQAGVAWREASAADKAERRVQGLVQFTDPGGFAIDIYYGAENDAEPFRPGRAMAGFKTGAQGLGHIVVVSERPEDQLALYRDVLGFRLSDTIAMAPGITAWFLHCNSRHHSLALVKPRPGSPAGLHHVMLEVTTLADVGHALDLCAAHGVPLAVTLGQHTNDRMVSFYLVSPSGFRIEYGYAGLEIDDATWTVQHWTAAKFWGHQRVEAAAR
jgi:2,3-dihydroxybiphenyl 1,2-dioxygenase